MPSSKPNIVFESSRPAAYRPVPECGGFVGLSATARYAMFAPVPSNATLSGSKSGSKRSRRVPPSANRSRPIVGHRTPPLAPGRFAHQAPAGCDPAGVSDAIDSLNAANDTTPALANRALSPATESAGDRISRRPNQPPTGITPPFPLHDLAPGRLCPAAPAGRDSPGCFDKQNGIRESFSVYTA
jgi:hypothetical protein